MSAVRIGKGKKYWSASAGPNGACASVTEDTSGIIYGKVSGRRQESLGFR
jgi:hypothetical protein